MRFSLPVGALLSATMVLSSGCTAGGPPASSATASRAAPSAVSRSGCGSPIELGPLPEWALAGFSGDSSMPHVMGDRGDIVAAIFAYPLAVTRPDGSSNKILWVSKPDAPPGDLQIDATRDGTGETVQRHVTGGPGPSIIDLPKAGCWRLTLTWPGHTDTMDLVYQP